MDSLRRSAEAPDLPMNVHLRLRGSANAMNRAAQQCRKALEQRRKSAATPPAGEADPTAAAQPTRTFTEDDLNAALSRVTAVMQQARAPQKKPTYWEAKREQERQARLAKRAMAAQIATNQSAATGAPA